MKFVGRGTSTQPTNRFETIALEPILDDLVDDQEGGLEISHESSLCASVSNRTESNQVASNSPNSKKKTVFLDDQSQSVVSENKSPDLNFRYSVNPYRGCEHGCSYCYARPYHEYLGMSAGLDFETKIIVKRDAPQLLKKWLSRKNWQCEPVNFSGVTDAYQPIERKLQLTRDCLKVVQKFRQPTYIVTKNRLVARDIDILAPMAEQNLIRVAISVTTLDPALAKIMEPRTSTPNARLDAIRELTSANVPVHVLLAPVIPGINDIEIPSIIEAVAEAGAEYVSYVTLRLPLAVEPIFLDWLNEHFPIRASKVVQILRSMRDGKLNESNFHDRMRGTGSYAEQIKETFRVFRKKFGVDRRRGPVDCSLFRVPGKETQRELF